MLISLPKVINVLSLPLSPDQEDMLLNDAELANLLVFRVQDVSIPSGPMGFSGAPC